MFKDPWKRSMLILLLPCSFKIVPTNFSIPSGLKSRHQPAKMQPAEGAQNLGFAPFRAAGPLEKRVQQRAGGEERSWAPTAVGPGCWPVAGSGKISGRWILQAGTPQQQLVSAVACSVSPSGALCCGYEPTLPSHHSLPEGGQRGEP